MIDDGSITDPDKNHFHSAGVVLHYLTYVILYSRVSSWQTFGEAQYLCTYSSSRIRTYFLTRGPYFNYVSTFLTIFDQLSNLVSMFTK